MKIVISRSWNLGGPDVFEKRQIADTREFSSNSDVARLADDLLAQYPAADMAHVLTDSGGHWYKSRYDLGRTFERNGKTFSAGWTFNTSEGDV